MFTTKRIPSRIISTAEWVVYKDPQWGNHMDPYGSSYASLKLPLNFVQVVGTHSITSVPSSMFSSRPNGGVVSCGKPVLEDGDFFEGVCDQSPHALGSTKMAYDPCGIFADL